MVFCDVIGVESEPVESLDHFQPFFVVCTQLEVVEIEVIENPEFQCHVSPIASFAHKSAFVLCVRIAVSVVQTLQQAPGRPSIPCCEVRSAYRSGRLSRRASSGPRPILPTMSAAACMSHGV